jgi:hypothetical protein
MCAPSQEEEVLLAPKAFFSRFLRKNILIDELPWYYMASLRNNRWISASRSLHPTDDLSLS